ncbi:hypothetical protein BH20ACI1_BH20ACI1_12020 [soil metagenome]
MFKKYIAACLLIFAASSTTILAQDKTVINDANAKKMLLGKHLLSLQWISWEHFGAANVVNKNGVFYLKGEQKQRGGTDYVKVDGIITEINAKDFKFDGTIEMKISHNGGGEPCKREGEMTFAITKNRKYWRLQEMNNPCDEVVDYVDIYFK